MAPTIRIVALLACLAVSAVAAARADEGLWTFDNFPAEKMRHAYGFAPDAAWLDHLRGASVRLPGCSGGVVSAMGLVQTNHHCIPDCIKDLSALGQNIAMTPLIAASQADERACPGLTAEIVTDITDVTADMARATAGLDGEAVADARDAAIAEITKTCAGDDPTRYCEVVTLYEGGRYALYAYHTYSDVRLVFAPETAAGSFGGDPDNFNFPRFGFDVAFLRLYENDAPAPTPNHLKWRHTPLTAGEPVFISGNPGETGRRWTLSTIGLLIDIYYPWQLATVSELRGRLLAYSEQGTEQARVASALLADVENNFKGIWGERAALAAPGFLAGLRRSEETLKAAIHADPTLAAMVGDAWGEIASSVAERFTLYLRDRYLERGAGGDSQLFAYARDLVRTATERPKPEAERMNGYSDGDLQWITDNLFADRPVSSETETLLLGFWLSKMREYLTADDPTVRKILGKESPEGLAARLVAQTKLGDPAERRRLYDGGSAAIDASADPLILLAKSFDEEGRALNKRYSTASNAAAEAAGRIAKARFALYGDTEYPDATGTLRINFGRVAGWTEPDGRAIAPFTTFAGLFDRATGAEPYKLAPLWDPAREKLSPGTIFNFATDNDTIGGNSGSPVVDRNGELVGAMFDGNSHGFGGFFMFDPKLNRTVAIAATAIEEGLSKVYGLDRIVGELKAD